MSKLNHLGRTSSHRKALMSNMTSDLILRKRIKTTVSKAKALRQFAEPIINKGKENTTHSRRVVFSYLQNKEAVRELFYDISAKIMNRPGGYTRILKTGFREGDNAEMCIIELVDYNENMLSTGNEKKPKTKRKRIRHSKKMVDKETQVNTISSETPSISKLSSLQSTRELNIIEQNKKNMTEELNIIKTTPYSYEIDILIHDEGNKILKVNKEYSIDVMIQLYDQLEREFIKNEFMVCLSTVNSTIRGKSIKNIEFDKSKKGIVIYKIIPQEKGQETLEFDFLQNYGLVKSLPCKLEIV